MAESSALRSGRHRHQPHVPDAIAGRHGHRAGPVVRGEHDAAGIPARSHQLVGRQRLARQRLVEQRPQPLDVVSRPLDQAQNSVLSLIFSLIALYSGLWVSGMSDMSLPMLPVTFMRPCMNAALASSSPFCTATLSA